MELYVCGVSDRRAPIALREKLSFTRGRVAELDAQLSRTPGVLGCALLSTCNRTELYCSCEEGTAPDGPGLLCRAAGADPALFEGAFRCERGEDAARRLMEVAAGLRSRIWGEDQILSQVREALALARSAGAADPVLETWFRIAVSAGKELRTRVKFSGVSPSAAARAVEVLGRDAGGLEGRRALVIGNGEMGKRSALALVEEGADVTVTVRQYRSGIVEIPQGCKRINYGERMALLPACDLVVSATSSPNTTIKYEDMAALALEGDMILIDLAVPRDVEPEVQDLPHVTLYDIDHFPVCPQSKKLQDQLAMAEGLLKEQQEEFVNWYECRDVIPKVQKVGQASAEDLVWRMGKTVKKLALSTEERSVLEAGTEEAAAKVIRRLLFALRDEGGGDLLRQCLSVWEKVYHE